MHRFATEFWIGTICILVFCLPAIAGQSDTKQKTKAKGAEVNESAAPVASTIPESVEDPAFDRYLDLDAVQEAVVAGNAEGLVNQAEQLQNGEIVLLRKHRTGVTASQLMQLAVGLAVQSRDPKSLERIGDLAGKNNDSELAKRAKLASKLASAPRSFEPLMVSIDDLSPEAFLELKQALVVIRGASLLGNRSSLERLIDNLKESEVLEDSQKQILIKRAQEAMKNSATDKNGNALEKLLSRDRGIHFPTIPTPSIPIPKIPSIPPQVDPRPHVPFRTYTQLHVHNATPWRIQVAIDYIPKGSRQSRKRGWWALNPGQTKYIADFNTAWFGIYGETTSRNIRKWWGEHGFRTKAFSSNVSELPYRNVYIKGRPSTTHSSTYHFRP